MQKIGIVIPFYNELERFPIAYFKKFFLQHLQYFFYFVDDGSTDDTLAMLRQIQKGEERIQVYTLTNNSGKAEAVRQGMLACAKWQEFDFIGFIDADMSTPLEEVPPLIATLNTAQGKKYKVSVGSRVKRLGATIVRRPLRHYLGRIFATVVGVFFNLKVYDTQCGIKFFQANIVFKIFNEPFVSSWIFDVEIFLRLSNLLGGKQALEQETIEIPLLHWVEKSNSKISPLYWLKAPFELIKVYRVYKK